VSEIEHLLVSGVRCDARGCTAEITGEPLPSYTGAQHYQALAEAAGWSYYAGRSRRTYCPDHQPSPGHRMHRISPGRPLVTASALAVLAVAVLLAGCGAPADPDRCVPPTPSPTGAPWVEHDDGEPCQLVDGVWREADDGAHVDRRKPRRKTTHPRTTLTTRRTQ
jgi:hypothetical protein